MPSFSDKVEHKADKAREAVSDKVRPDEPGLGEKAKRAVRDAAYELKGGAHDARKDTAHAIHPNRSV